MPDQLLLTKLFVPPPRPKVVPRPRLIERMAGGLRHKVILISAPAGFGKTTLVSEWLAGCLQPVAWLSLNEEDNEPTRFLTYLITALQTLDLSDVQGIDSKIGEGILIALQSPQPPPTVALLSDLLNEITSYTENFVLVLDDYHVIDSKPVEEALTFLVNHLPPQMHLVITTREDPHLPLARLRTRDQLTELRAADLRFTPVEAAEFLNTVMDLKLSSEDISALETRTEGWISGLQLAALSMQGHQDPTNFIKSFTGSHHFVLDYLIEEVLHQQPEDIQTFLLRTSILDNMCGPLCDAVLGSSSTLGQNTLEYIDHANLFIIPLDNERRWYRYHHLFGELLRQRLGIPKEFAEFNLRACKWHEANGDLAEAFHYAITAGDLSRAAGLAEAAWQGMDGRFQSAAWLGWVKKLPEEVIHLRPVLCTQIGLSFMDAGNPEASESRLQDAERWLNGPSDGMVVVDQTQLQPLPAMIAMARSYNAQVLGNLSDTVKYAELALQLIPEDDLFRRAQATIMLEVTHWASGNLESALSAMCDWMNSMQKMGNYVFAVATAFAVADIQKEQGHLREAEKTYLEYLQLAAEHGKEAQQITAHHYLGLAMLHHEMGKDASVVELMQTARELGEQTTLVDWNYRWHIAQARLKESLGDLDSAIAHLDEAKRRYVKNPVPDTRPIEALKTKLYIKEGRLTLAQDWVHKQGLSADDEITYLNEYEHLILARVLIAVYQHDHTERSILDAIRLLERLLKGAEEQNRMGNIIEILLVQALALQTQGDLRSALASLEHALFLAQPEGYVRIFVDEGEPMRSLISDFRSQFKQHSGGHDHPLSGYVDKLLAAFKIQGAKAQSTTTARKPEMIEPLSQRELEVLRLIAQGLSNREIGERLFLALSTVKGHARLIFDKLQVQSRTEAVAHAHELGLL
jgi:LuxR family transcriptional regulator, maltose regulon positive regulatory protein